jgi:hypothetical protein
LLADIAIHMVSDSIAIFQQRPSGPSKRSRAIA